MKNRLTILASAIALTASTTMIAPAQAGLLHRHPTATGVAAGVAAHHMAAHAHGGFMHRHPVMTGIGAGMLAHHMAKHHG